MVIPMTMRDKGRGKPPLQGASWQRCQSISQNILPLATKGERKALHSR